MASERAQLWAGLAVDAYIEALLWSETDEHGRPLDGYLSPVHAADGVEASAEAELADFFDLVAEQDPALADLLESDPDRGGHDFCLSRNRHGAGFWDGDWDGEHLPPKAGSRLHEAAITFGSASIEAEHHGRGAWTFRIV